MPLVTGSEILQAARQGHYAVGAFNVHMLDMIPAVVEAAASEGSPVILQFTVGSLAFMGWEYAASVARHAAAAAPVPVAVHLDHGDSFATAVRAIRNGFTSVMIDGSALPYERNLALTRQVVEAARSVGVSVEAEIGHVGGVEDGQGGEHAWLTAPADAQRFADESGVDYLATAFGTAHGFYQEEPRLDMDRLAAIGQRVSLPLVMHGGSGVPDAQVEAAIVRGIAKINVATELKDAWAHSLRQTLAQQPDEIDPRRLLAPARRAVQALVRAKIHLFGVKGV